MKDWSNRFSRRRFLGGVALVGATPVLGKLESLPQGGRKRWTGDDFDEGHERLRNPRAYWQELEQGGKVEEVAGRYDTIIVGGGISGLTVAYKLARDADKQRRVLLLERERETGGVSKSENWNGIEYALGAAYMVDPEPPDDDDPADPSQERLNSDLLIDLGLREEGEDLHGACGKQRRWSTSENHLVFTNDRVLEEHEVLTKENEEFFHHVVEGDRFPAVPPEDEWLLEKMDNVSFQEFLRNAALQREVYGRAVGRIPAAGWEAIEYYFWGAFGTNTWETSAYHGMNFYAAEFTKILVFPGGNAFIAKALARKINAISGDILRTGSYVLLIEPERDAPEGERPGWMIKVLRDGRGYVYRTRTAVFASPLFLAKRMVLNLPAAQVAALDRLDYRSFVVANVLMTPPMRSIFGEGRILSSYEMQRVRGADLQHTPPDLVSAKNVFSDIVNATFVGCSDRLPHTVLTVYRPYPYAHGRERLRYLSYEYVEDEIRRAVLEAYEGHGLKPEHIHDIRLSRWGHPMIIPRPGQLAGGTIARARQGQPGLFFSHTECYGAPAIENAFAAAHRAVADINAYLG